MKAKDYAEKYGEGLKSNNKETYIKTVNLMINELAGEVSMLTRQRNCKTWAAIESVLEEINNKCNKAILLSEAPLKRNSFWYIMKSEYLKEFSPFMKDKPLEDF